MELEEARPSDPVTWRPKSNLGLFLMWADDFGGARAILEADRQDGREKETGARCRTSLEAGRAGTVAGDWERAADYANECVEAAEWTDTSGS